ncbi:hypothetical protein DFH05DRAFT_1390683 [Lentinula detonsa]|uniref:Uncharacterized protein n=1 Tax=Lentinula detonsa TaxID=2804962 RepID=A0A9W8P8N6_9AGAR|nr:hypothetical protein DFH05DRAFT_1390683 [Lentinula detonsa]KAJ3984417.1 hypothetical protein F5890DRAFT_41533 [Lentinula detonsa]
MPLLPSSFTSLYRLFLRTSSASVLHQSLAVRNIRALWRPIFSDAAHVIEKLQAKPCEREQELLRNWLRNWETQMDRTLSLLYASATSRGLPHKLTRNLSQLYYAEYDRMTSRRYPVWNAQLPKNSREYQIPVPDTTQKALNKEEKARQAQYLEDRAWNALSFAVKMAEGRDRLSLGRVVVKGKLWQT